MRTSKASSGLASTVVLLLATAASGADVTELLSRMRTALEPPGDMRAAVEFVVTNAQGESVHWTGRMYRVDGPNAKLRLVLDNPVDLRGLTLTGRRADGQPDSIQLYLPSVRRVRELSGDLRGESFLGTDFNFEDLGLVEFDFHSHAIKGKGEVDGRACTLVESAPSQGWWYTRLVRCIDDQDFLPRRTEYYGPGGTLYKVRTMDRVATIGKYPTPTELTMEVVPGKTSSRIVLSNVEYDVGLKDALFDGH